LHAPDYFLIAAEGMAVRVQYCGGKKGVECRTASHARRGQSLSDAGRWRADANLLSAGIAAYREALHDVEAESSTWIELHTLIGSTLAQLSERYEGEARRPLLRQALDEYEAASALDPSQAWRWALIHQNVCSIRQPLAAIDVDRASTRRAIEECEKARVYYAARNERTNEAAAHYNAARAEGRLAEWDHDEAAAVRAVEHVRRTVQLCGEDNAILSRAFGQVHLAQALLRASDLARTPHENDDARERSRALLAEARASLREAEPILRNAQAKGYLEEFAKVRSRLEGAESRS
jgi:hypothetical protein